VNVYAWAEYFPRQSSTSSQGDGIPRELFGVRFARRGGDGSIRGAFQLRHRHDERSPATWPGDTKGFWMKLDRPRSPCGQFRPRILKILSRSIPATASRCPGMWGTSASCTTPTRPKPSSAMRRSRVSRWSSQGDRREVREMRHQAFSTNWRTHALVARFWASRSSPMIRRSSMPWWPASTNQALLRRIASSGYYEQLPTANCAWHRVLRRRHDRAAHGQEGNTHVRIDYAIAARWCPCSSTNLSSPRIRQPLRRLRSSIS